MGSFEISEKFVNLDSKSSDLLLRSLKISVLLLVITACESQQKPKEIEWQTMEIFTINGKYDTVNRVDGQGRKQGKWIPSPLNDLRDTVFYLSDSLIKRVK